MLTAVLIQLVERGARLREWEVGYSLGMNFVTVTKTIALFIMCGPAQTQSDSKTVTSNVEKNDIQDNDTGISLVSIHINSVIGTLGVMTVFIFVLLCGLVLCAKPLMRCWQQYRGCCQQGNQGAQGGGVSHYPPPQAGVQQAGVQQYYAGWAPPPQLSQRPGSSHELEHGAHGVSSQQVPGEETAYKRTPL